ncbi:MAG: hypothetical protein HZC17_09930 [Candidatus Omnitrophica bacterium]|nr:hypothetical protein [Candidatus Omnitrophota bacterium]
MAGKVEESQQKYFFDRGALLRRYQARESGVRKINEIFTSYSQLYTSGLIFGEVIAELKRILENDKAESILPLLLGDVKSGRLKILETKPGPVQEEVNAIRAVQSKLALKPLDVFDLALTRLYLKEIQDGKAPVFVSTDKSAAQTLKELGHETLLIEE